MNNFWINKLSKNYLTRITIISTLFCLTLPYSVKAEDPGECFMVNNSGRMIALRKLCGDKTISPHRSNKVFRVPIKRRLGRTPVIEVTFNEKKTFEMILDTGANNSLIPLEVAKALQLKPTGFLQAQIADGSQVQFPISKIKSMTAGGAIAKNIEVAIAPKAAIGLLGHDFFGNYDIKILEREVEFYLR